MAEKLPTRDGSAPLHELARDPLSVFLFMALTGKELGALIKELGLSVPGFRNDRLSDAERADVLADEIRADPTAARPVLELIRKIYEFPALDGVSLSPDVASEMGLLAVEEDAPVRILWRLLADPSKEVREQALPVLDRLVKAFYGPPPEGDEPRSSPADAREKKAPPPTAELARLRKTADRAEAEASGLKTRVDELKEELRAARAATSEAQRAAGDAKRARDAADRKLVKASSKAPRPSAGAAKAAIKEAEHAKHDLGAAQTRAEEAEAESARLREELEALAAKLKAGAAPRVEANPEDAAPDAPPTSWLLPRFTREFYDSLDGWEPRIVRAAFKQAFLLSENHRHPSLRAIPLEGLPDYYRVRVATDVRLIYRRAHRDVEMLSLIDREDLDRYVREAKTR